MAAPGAFQWLKVWFSGEDQLALTVGRHATARRLLAAIEYELGSLRSDISAGGSTSRDFAGAPASFRSDEGLRSPERSTTRRLMATFGEET